MQKFFLCIFSMDYFSVTLTLLCLITILNILSISDQEYDELSVLQSKMMETLPSSLEFLTIQYPATKNATNDVD